MEHAAALACLTLGLAGVSRCAACTVEAVESLVTWFSSSLSSAPPSLLRASCRRNVLWHIQNTEGGDGRWKMGRHLFQWFLIALSVRPGKNFAISAQRLPRLLCASINMASSSALHASFTTTGSS